MRARTVVSLILITAALSGCASAVEPAPTPTPTATPDAEIISNCWLNHADIGVPDGSEEIWEAAYAADVGDGAFVGERPWMEWMPSDGMCQASCSRQPWIGQLPSMSSSGWGRIRLK